MGSSTIAINIYYDNANNFYPNGILTTISKDAQVVGYESKPLESVPYGEVNTVRYNYLKIKDPYKGLVFAKLTQKEFQELVGLDTTDANATNSYTYVVGTDFSAGTTVTKPELYNLKLLSIQINNNTLDLTTVSISYNQGSNTGTITFPSSLTNGTKVQVIGRKL